MNAEPHLKSSQSPKNSYSGIKSFLISLTIIGCTYAIWLINFWPGALGEDSRAILMEVESNGKFQSGKPALWYFFVSGLYTPLKLVEIPIGFQLAFCALIFSRMLGWQWENGLKKTAIFNCFFICLAPHMILYAGILYADAIFSVAATGLAFELWLVSRKRTLSNTSLAIIFAALPFAAFSRPNGIVFIAITLTIVFALKTIDKIKIITIITLWMGCFFSANSLHKTYRHEFLFPIALFETVNFLQPRPMNLWIDSPRVSERSIQAITETQSLEKIVSIYDRDYWDTLIFKKDGPQLYSLSEKSRKTIITEFFKYNIWRNIPAFISSRVNIFLVSALAQGGTPSHDYTANVLLSTTSKSKLRPFKSELVDEFFRKTYEKNYHLRAILWSPLLGIALLLIVTMQSIRRKTHYTTVICIGFVLQLGAIFIFSIAGEHRYLLPFFVLPLALMPIMASYKEPH